MFPNTKPQQCVITASLTSNDDTGTVNTTRYLPGLGSVASIKVCRVCLAMSRKMYLMSEHQLSVMYSRVTGVEINTEEKLPQMLCWECVARLSSANNFIEKSLKTQWLLVDKLNSSSNLTISDIESINREHYNIRSTLGCKVIIENDSNYFNLPESKDHFNNEESWARLCEINDNGISNEEEKNIITEVYVSGVKDPIKTEYLDVIDEQNVSDEDISDEKDSIKREYLDVTEEQISDEEYNETELNICENVFEVPIDNVMHKGENCKLDEARDRDKTIRSKVTPLRKRRREALSQCKELYTKDALQQITAESSKASETADHPQIKQEISEQNNFLEETENTNNIASVSTGAVDNKMNLTLDDTGHTVDMDTKDGVFTCNYCSYESNLKRRLNMHINTMHTKNISYNCSLCSYKAYDKRTLTRHVNAKHTKTNVYNCSLCDYNSYDKSNLTRHINNKHTKTNVYSCTFCSFKTFQQSNLNAHIRVKHTKSDVYSCTLCSYVAYDKRTLTKHVNAKHTETEVHNCPHCSFKTYLKGNLNQHINAKHTKAKVYNCEYCSFKTYQRGSLNVHVNAKHTKANVYTCDYCSFVTYQHGSLSIHVNAKHVKRIVYNCSLCSYKSYRKSSLSAHISTKHA